MSQTNLDTANRSIHPRFNTRAHGILSLGAIFLFLLGTPPAHGQEPATPSTSETTTAQQVQRLTEAVARAQTQLEASQQQIIELRKELQLLQQQLANSTQPTTAPTDATASATAAQLAQKIDDLSEQQAIQASQIATHEQSKVESASKYPVRINGLILMNGFVNTRWTDNPAAPSYVSPGGGATGLSVRQTILGLEANGPHVFGARTHGDISVDFFGTSNQGGYNNAGGLLRLRTAHAALTWKNTEAFIEYDRSILSPNTPSSLTALAVPALSWSGNLWSWNPQIGLTHQIDLNTSTRLKLQAALIDVEDAPSPITATNPTTLAELSRWPGSEARIALAGGKEGIGPEIGIGGYFSPHRTSDKQRFDAWAGTLDLRLPLPARLEFTGSAFRGQALGGLGAGAFKDYIYNPYAGATEARALDDVGGWAQVKERANARLEFNLAYGIDNAFASQVRPYIQSTLTTPYLGLIRNQTYFTNVIYSPNAYLLFSLEYRHIQSTYIAQPTSDGNVVGVAAAYKF